MAYQYFSPSFFEVRPSPPFYSYPVIVVQKEITIKNEGKETNKRMRGEKASRRKDRGEVVTLTIHLGDTVVHIQSILATEQTGCSPEPFSLYPSQEQNLTLSFYPDFSFTVIHSNIYIETLSGGVSVPVLGIISDHVRTVIFKLNFLAVPPSPFKISADRN
jgi:hypothetical protein